MFSRRKFLATSAALPGTLAIAGCNTKPVSPLGMDESFTGLNTIAKTKGLRFGNAVAAWADGASGNPFDDPAYMDLVKKECGILVGENEFKRYTIQPVKGDYRFDRPDKIAAFARENDLGLRGHTLLWNRNEFLPGWVQELDLNAASAEAHLETYFADVLSRYNDTIYSWDVVNETIDPETGELRDTIFSRTLGADVIDTAFRIARAQAPNTQLVYNDYMSWENHSRTHRDGVLKMLRDLKDRGAPIDALGVQGHIGTFAGDAETGFEAHINRDEWMQFLADVQDLDLDVIVTEFDVNDEKLVADIETRDQIVAEFAKDYLDRTLSFTNVKELLAWGLTDKYSWLQEWWPREDGLAKRPAPYDMNLQPKPLRIAIADALANAPERTPLG